MRADEIDDTPAVLALHARLVQDLPQLTALLTEVNDHWCYEDGVYRFYHQSYKVYGLAQTTKQIIAALRALAPELELHPYLAQILTEGTDVVFEREHNARWIAVTRPIVEAFMHAKYFLEMAVKYGTELEAPPRMMPSGWAAFLYFYGLR